ncbi:MAG: YegP family protein [Hyphomicrobiales bacterium]
MRKNSASEARFEKKKSKNGKSMFNLKASNGQVIGTSEMYESEASCDNGIASVMKNAPDAKVDDQTG